MDRMIEPHYALPNIPTQEHPLFISRKVTKELGEEWVTEEVRFFFTIMDLIGNTVAKLRN